MSENDVLYQNVSNIINNEIKPYIEADGGNIKLKSVDEGVVYVHLSGACAGCPGAAMTLKGGVERILKMKLPDVKEVRLAY
ncbi:MAG: NifU family protein [Bacteroidetes bacterium]|nr:MAG: NifU family protein [Bacteroidota bacterium]